ncbi:hypothetical protein ASPWEDRAFT_170467 [Aspergillus wentii DTO 134E9]|uniref:Ig-like domain-containing protein n=1 Tax=Aspergillus wentii DTO 134E9 TaxID=1073089 RepID=A0A1L9RQ72_ASPWE|nr:uncharacterized protein ASPWEDRAFT_170467 [Aspergillus wentii DTO 134E9]KAI9923900.1 hypothetical protein MW887_008205 [Aspergillus wentii]OJJ36967.1 hypothetical protein ASPWEDRAFT_170467 [Aspergillus wentii DTO 134E9]
MRYLTLALAILPIVTGTPAFKRDDSQYTDGEGTYVNSDSIHHYASGVKCWNDWYVVNQDITYSPWQVASGKVYCSGTEQCQVTKMTGDQTCETSSIEISAGIQSDIFNMGVSAGYEVQNCNQAQDTTFCTWNDDQCHVVWTQQQLFRTQGYTRRRCSDKGDYTAWMKDYEWTAPTNSVNYGCGSSCDDSP